MNKKTYKYGLILILLGIAIIFFSNYIGGSNVKDFISGVLLGMAIALELVGVYVSIRGLANKETEDENE